MKLRKIEEKDILNKCTWLYHVPEYGINICERKRPEDNGKEWIEDALTGKQLGDKYDEIYSGVEADGLLRVRKGKKVALMDTKGKLVTKWYGWIYPIDSRGVRGVHEGKAGRFWLKAEG